MPIELFANQSATTVTSGGTTAPAAGTVETWTVASSASFPAAATAAGSQFRVVEDDATRQSEIVLVTDVSGTTWTVTRGAEGTTPVVHPAGFTVVQTVSAGALAGFSRLLARVGCTTSQTGIVADTAISGMTATVVVPAGRRIKITVWAHIYSTVAGDNFSLRLHASGGTASVIGAAESPLLAASTQQLLSLTGDHTPTAGTWTYLLTLVRTTGSGSLGYYATAGLPSLMFIEDVGAA